MKTLIKNDDQWWELMEDASGRWWLEVVCGGAGMYEVKFRLTRKEEAACRKSPAALPRLVRKVQRHPREFLKRGKRR